MHGLTAGFFHVFLLSVAAFAAVRTSETIMEHVLKTRSQPSPVDEIGNYGNCVGGKPEAVSGDGGGGDGVKVAGEIQRQKATSFVDCSVTRSGDRTLRTCCRHSCSTLPLTSAAYAEHRLSLSMSKCRLEHAASFSETIV